MRTLTKLLLALFFIGFISCRDQKKEEEETDAMVKEIEAVESELEQIEEEVDQDAKELEEALNELDNI